MKTRVVILSLSAILCGRLAFAKSAVESLGDYFQAIVPAYAFGMAMNESDWAGAIQFAESFAATEASVFGLKLAVSEDRPDHSDNNSFPSGHTAAAFSGATFIHKRYGWKRAVVPYAAAAFTGYSRVAADKHHVWDVLAGAAIAAAWTWAFVDSAGSVRLSASPSSVDFGFNFRF